MTVSSILIAGCGDVGSQAGLLMNQQGHQVYGLRRNINQLPQGIQGIHCDLRDPASLSSLPACDLLLYIATPAERGEQGYRDAYVNGLQNVLAALPQPPKHLFFTSSTGVYHQNDHSTVDEQSPTDPERFNGQIMLEAEQLAQQSGIPATSVRFSGIYGPGRNHLINQVKAGICAPENPIYISNRIHRDDCAGVLAHLMKRAIEDQPLAPLYLASDDEPTPIHEVMQWLAQELEVTPSEIKVTRMAGSKKCDNSLLKNTGYQFHYPSFRDGYKALLAGS